MSEEHEPYVCKKDTGETCYCMSCQIGEALEDAGIAAARYKVSREETLAAMACVFHSQTLIAMQAMMTKIEHITAIIPVKIHAFMESDKMLCILSGAAGTGKTHLIRHFKNKWRNRCYHTAMTHKAVRVADADGTLHSATNLIPTDGVGTPNNPCRYRHNRDIGMPPETKLPCNGDVLIVDEVSMMGAGALAVTLSQYARRGCKVLLVGDNAQLGPVGWDAPPKSLDWSKYYDPAFEHIQRIRIAEPDAPPAFKIGNGPELTEVVRQIAGNPIIQTAHQVRPVVFSGQLPVIETSMVGDQGVRVIGARDKAFPLEAGTAVVDGIMSGEVWDAIILTFTNAQRENYNNYIRGLLLGRAEADRDFMARGDVVFLKSPITKWREGGLITLMEAYVPDRVEEAYEDEVEGVPGYRIHLDEHYLEDGLFLAIGKGTTYKAREADKVRRIREVLQPLQIMAKKTNNWREYYRVKESFHPVQHAYALTTHSAQGTTVTSSYIDAQDMGIALNFEGGQRNLARLMYTALTRASDKATIRGSYYN